MIYDPPDPIALVTMACLAIAVVLFIIAVIFHENDNS